MRKLLEGVMGRPSLLTLWSMMMLSIGGAISVGSLVFIAKSKNSEELWEIPLTSSLVPIVNFVLLMCLLILVFVFSAALLGLARKTIDTADHIQAGLVEDRRHRVESSIQLSEVKQVVEEVKKSAIPGAGDSWHGTPPPDTSDKANLSLAPAPEKDDQEK